MESNVENEREADGSTHLLEEEKSNHLPPENPTVVKQNGDHGDGAGEKLVPEDGKLKSNKEGSEVKFISADSQNGDAKIDIENVKIAFAGMGKEELMKFANDPFWIKMRWFLFIFFWLLWAAMLAGAIAIIVMAPKCAAPAPLKWWEQTPLYQVYVGSFKDGGERQDGKGDLKGLQSKLDYIQSLGVKGIIISSVLNSFSDTETVVDFKDVAPMFGTMDDFRNLTAAMKNKELHLVMRFVPNHSSDKHPWFLKSIEKEGKYADYYIWANASVKSGEEGSLRKPPNNWPSVSNGSAWEWNEKRGQYFLHQFNKDQPDLNFRNPAVVDEFKDILSFWLKQGVSGFEFDKVDYLLEDETLQDEEPSLDYGFNQVDYGFYSHARTSNLPGVKDVLATLKQVFVNETDVEGMFSVTSSVSISDKVFNYFNNKADVVIDVLRHTILMGSHGKDFKAEDLEQSINNWLRLVPNDSRPYWELGNGYSSRVASRFSSDVVDGLNMVVMLLPGTPVTFYGEELGMEDAETSSRSPMQWSNGTNAGFSSYEPLDMALGANYEEANVEAERQASKSHLKVYEALVKARSSQSIMYGDFKWKIFQSNNASVFAFTRLKSGNPGYLVAFNPSNIDVTINFKELKNIPDELTVSLTSTGFRIDRTKLPADAVYIPAKAGLVLTFVPKQ